ncbi:MAG: PCC domain-containing protein [Prochlorococcaceae cyanobacterium]
MRAVPLHLDPGSDVRRSIEQLASRQALSGFVLSVVGNLTQAAFQCPGKSQPTLLSGELEIITLQGTFSPDGVHLHLSFSDADCQVWGGHLEPGSLVFKGADLLLGCLEGSPAQPAFATGAATASANPTAIASATATASITASSHEPRVALAVAPGCPYSRRALRLLRTLGIAHRLVEPQAGLPVPQVHIDGVLVGGYAELAELHGSGQLEALR